MSDATDIPSAGDAENRQAAEQLLPLVYEELRRIAASKMANEAAGHTLQPTALVHEAWLRLAGDQNAKFEGRAHFFAAAAEAMRRILIDNARRKLARRHGGDQQRLDVLEVEIAAPSEDEQLLAIHEALDELAAQDSLQAEVVKLRFFIGLKNEEAAQVLGISEKTVRRYWTHAKAWLYARISKRG